MSISLHIDLEEIEKNLILRLDGRLDAATVSILERKINSLINEKHFFVYLDFLRIDYLSSAGLRLLLAESKRLKQKNGALVIFSISEEVMDIIKLAGFDKILLIFETEQDAIQHKL
jgi:anti-sigma B factor antagonist/stage II sporulation protein AA (anti-sigma F factor antagonist)